MSAATATGGILTGGRDRGYFGGLFLKRGFLGDILIRLISAVVAAEKTIHSMCLERRAARRKNKLKQPRAMRDWCQLCSVSRQSVNLKGKGVTTLEELALWKALN